MDFPVIGTKVVSSVVIVDGISLGVMVTARFRESRRSRADGHLGSNNKLSTHIEEHHCCGKGYVINL